MNSVADIVLTPIPGKKYFNTIREWREDFIYFVMVDRFHDSNVRTPTSLGNARSVGITAPDNAFYGGTIRGIKEHLDYIAGLGCTAVWLSPVFENNPGAYHGYDISNYLAIDPNFGSEQDLIDLVEAAHARDMRIILDVVINHSGNNWSYPGGFSFKYIDDQRFPFGAWRRPDRPIPSELRDPEWYHRRGEIQNYDAFPEVQNGDISSLKDFANDDDEIGSRVINALISAHCHWIRVADVDGFRVDAVKHMGALACSRFSSNIREYAYSLGKRDFFLFGELATPNDDVYNAYLGANTSATDDDTVFFGLDSLLDFRLAEGIFDDPDNAPLRDVLKGVRGPQTLFNRLEAQRNRALNRGEMGRYLVSFVDNHDSFWQPGGRFANGADDSQVIAAIGFVLCTLGTACIYYATEQGFSGRGGDNQMREAMFDRAVPGKNLLNTNCTIYTEIGRIAGVARSTQALRFGRIYYRQISGNGQDFGFPFGNTYTLAFSRLLYGQEVLVAYNVSASPRSDRVVVDATLHPLGSSLRFLYGAPGTVAVQQAADGTCFVQLNLSGHAFVILG